jgi:hypothetical protein
VCADQRTRVRNKMTDYTFTRHALYEAMEPRGITEDEVMKVIHQGSSWRHYDVSMRSRLDDLTVCWDQKKGSDEVTIITVWDNTNQIQSR